MKHILKYFQQEFGLARSEAVVVSSILGILVVGYVGRIVVPPEPTHDVIATQHLLKLLDSMQQAVDSNTNADKADQAYSQNSSDMPKPPTQHNKATRPSEPVNLNHASQTMLMNLPGIGPAMAERIVKERTVRPFATVDELTRVKGIGLKKLEKIRPFATAP